MSRNFAYLSYDINFNWIIIEAVNDHEKLAKGDINAIREHKEMFLHKAFFKRGCA